MKFSNPRNTSRISALNMLETQLTNGTKPLKVDGKTSKEQVQLSDSDKERIKKEINILKSKVVYEN